MTVKTLISSPFCSHLLTFLSEHFKSVNQIWLTCVELYQLVNQYKEYAHGNAHYERQVVLEKEMLPRINKPGNIRAVEPQNTLFDIGR